MRTITYFYKLDAEKSSAMVRDICSGTLRAPSTVYMWLKGERKPCFLEQRYIRSVVKKHYNVSVPLSELFA